MNQTNEIILQIRLRTGLQTSQISNVLKLIEEGCTIPFISRYRKEQTDNLDEVEVGKIKDWGQKLQELLKRKQSILETIEAQGLLHEPLRKKINECYDPTELEDIYLPYKPKRKTKADTARENGLEPLAKILMSRRVVDLSTVAKCYAKGKVNSGDDALSGARDIIAEWVSENVELRNKLRVIFRRDAKVRTKMVKGKEKVGEKYKDYFDFNTELARCPSFRLLAMFRAENEGIIRLDVSPPADKVTHAIGNVYLRSRDICEEQVQMACADSWKRLIAPSLENEIRNEAKEAADATAIEIFANNLKQLLLSPPLGEYRVLGIDPGFRTGCKLVALDENAGLLHHDTFYIIGSDYQISDSEAKLKKIYKQYKPYAIAVGDGTAGRETLEFARRVLEEYDVRFISVNEDGASVYSASEAAREEFPDLDLTVKGAISIARRLMDPLSELVKIDPKAIGVGQYQHDVDQSMLKNSLDRVVESCVNHVGVNLNTAGYHLLRYVSGLGPQLAKSIVAYRSDNGSFNSRSELLKVPRLGKKAFEQCAAFLRIRDGKNPLDNTGVHPERYELVKRMAKDAACSIEQLVNDESQRSKINISKYRDEEVGDFTLADIMKELEAPGLDPRSSNETEEINNRVKDIADLSAGMILEGSISNITEFGAFVNLGIKQDGLVHISHLADQFVKNPQDVVSLQQRVKVKVLEVDVARKRISLSMKGL